MGKLAVRPLLAIVGRQVKQDSRDTIAVVSYVHLAASRDGIEMDYFVVWPTSEFRVTACFRLFENAFRFNQPKRSATRDANSRHVILIPLRYQAIHFREGNNGRDKKMRRGMRKRRQHDTGRKRAEIAYIGFCYSPGTECHRANIHSKVTISVEWVIAFSYRRDIMSQFSQKQKCDARRYE